MKRRIGILIPILLILGGCGQKNVIENMTAEELYEKAQERFEDEDYFEAAELFQRIIFEYPGSEYVERVRFKLGDTHFAAGDYLLAANEYERFAREFPLNPRADEALYLAARSHERMTETYYHDQTETRSAISAYEQLVSKYPGSSYTDSALVKIHFLEDRLARKSFENGYFYFKKKLYDSAIIYFETMIDEFEESSWLAPALYYLAISYEKLNIPEEALEKRRRLVDEFPFTEEAMDVRERYPELTSGDGAPGSNSAEGGGG